MRWNHTLWCDSFRRNETSGEPRLVFLRLSIEIIVILDRCIRTWEASSSAEGDRPVALDVVTAHTLSLPLVPASTQTLTSQQPSFWPNPKVNCTWLLINIQVQLEPKTGETQLESPKVVYLKPYSQQYVTNGCWPLETQGQEAFAGLPYSVYP